VTGSGGPGPGPGAGTRGPRLDAGIKTQGAGDRCRGPSSYGPMPRARPGAGTGIRCLGTGDRGPGRSGGPSRGPGSRAVGLDAGSLGPGTGGRWAGWTVMPPYIPSFPLPSPSRRFPAVSPYATIVANYARFCIVPVRKNLGNSDIFRWHVSCRRDRCRRKKATVERGSEMGVYRCPDCGETWDQVGDGLTTGAHTWCPIGSPTGCPGCAAVDYCGDVLPALEPGLGAEPRWQLR
jgi:hypothetical protein